MPDTSTPIESKLSRTDLIEGLDALEQRLLWLSELDHSQCQSPSVQIAMD